MDKTPLAFLAGVLALSFGWHLVNFRRFRREGYQRVLDEIADSGLLDALKKYVAAPDARTRVCVRPHRVEIRTDLSGSLSLEVAPALLARLARESWELAVHFTRRIALCPR